MPLQDGPSATCWQHCVLDSFALSLLNTGGEIVDGLDVSHLASRVSNGYEVLQKHSGWLRKWEVVPCFVGRSVYTLEGVLVPHESWTMRPTTLVLLPGLDGTDVFFQPLLAALPEWVSPHVVCFPQSGANEYADLLPIVREAVSEIPGFYVLGSSFSGPLALMLAVAERAKVQGVILSATFVRPPRLIYAQLRFAAVTPMIWMIRAGRRIPVWLSRGPDDQLRRDKSETWRRVSAGMVAARIRALLNVDARELLRDCPHPMLCIAGTDDGIVPRRNVEEIVAVRPSVSVRTIKGRHFAIYTNPTAAADAITEFMDNKEVR